MNAEARDDRAIEGAQSKSPARHVAISGGFLVFMLSVLITDVAAPVPPKQLLGAEALKERELEENATFWDGSLFEHISRQMRGTSRSAEVLTGPWRAATMTLGGNSAPGVLVGSDGFMFLEHFRPHPQPGWESQMARAVHVARAVHERLAILGIRLLVVPVPSKSMVYPDKLPSSVTAHPELHETFLSQLHARDIACVNLLQALNNERAQHRVFCKTDTHWTPHGARRAAEEIARASGLMISEDQRSTVLREDEPTIDAGDALRYSGFTIEQVYTSGFVQDILKHGQVIQPLPIIRVFDHQGRKLEPPDLQPEPDGARGLLLGTSFTPAGGFNMLLQHYTDRSLRIIARAGGGPSESMKEAVALGVGTRLPEVIIWEFPLFNVLQEQAQFTGAFKLFAELPAPPFAFLSDLLSSLGHPQPKALSMEPGTLELDADGTAFRFPTQNLMQPGGGVLHLSLDGSSEHPVTVEVGGGERFFRATWPPRIKQLQIPLLTPMHGKPLFVRLRGTTPTEQIVTLKRMGISLAVALQPEALSATPSSARASLGKIRISAVKRDSRENQLMIWDASPLPLDVQDPPEGIGLSTELPLLRIR